mmetsp:Transcript_41716/g.65126  ORF Transcript_41716/g.65126 Transcript_41716/m.65126 type:complete len:273 (+) Transcript_41716:28-846(+)
MPAALGPRAPQLVLLLTIVIVWADLPPAFTSQQSALSPKSSALNPSPSATSPDSRTISPTSPGSAPNKPSGSKSSSKSAPPGKGATRRMKGSIEDTRNFAKWETRFNELVLFKQQHGDTRVPKNYKNNRVLGRWVNTERVRYTQFLRGGKTKDGNASGVPGENNRTDIAGKTSRGPMRLGDEVMRQLLVHRFSRLKRLGFVFNKYDNEWEGRFQARSANPIPRCLTLDSGTWGQGCSGAHPRRHVQSRLCVHRSIWSTNASFWMPVRLSGSA